MNAIDKAAAWRAIYEALSTDEMLDQEELRAGEEMLDVSLAAYEIWVEYFCEAELDEDEPPAPTAWRRFLNRARAIWQ